MCFTTSCRHTLVCGLGISWRTRTERQSDVQPSGMKNTGFLQKPTSSHGEALSFREVPLVLECLSSSSFFLLNTLAFGTRISERDRPSGNQVTTLRGWNRGHSVETDQIPSMKAKKNVGFLTSRREKKQKFKKNYPPPKNIFSLLLPI